MSSNGVNRWLVYEKNTSDLIAHLCELRGLDRYSLTPDYEAHLHDPYLLPDMEKAVKLVLEAKEKNWAVAVFGDYDADGTPASALLSLTLEQLKIEHQVFLPTREEGYGLRKEFIKSLGTAYKLLIVVDTGIASVHEIALARKSGIKVIVLDHHLPQAELPPADALIDPHLKHSLYPFVHLCGCALAYKLAVALSNQETAITKNFCKWIMDLVAISTVADMMPLIGENRVLVHYGLIVLRQNRRLGLRALLRKAGVDSSKITAGTIGFVIGPRLNASGRLRDNMPALKLLLARTESEAAELAEILERANTERQSLVEEVLLEAEKQLSKQNKKSDKILIITGDGWPAGVLGLVAGKFVALYNRPTIILTKEGNRLRGSGRSIPGYPLVDGLTSVAGLLETFGGHDQAAGLSLLQENFNDFAAELKKTSEVKITESDFVKTHYADALLDENELSLETVAQLESLQPFGFGNSKPLFVLPGAEVVKTRYLGATQSHLKLELKLNDLLLNGIGFGLAARYQESPNKKVSLLGYLERNTYLGKDTLQFQIIDYLPAEVTIEKISWPKTKANLSA